MARVLHEIRATWAVFSPAERIALGWIAFVVSFAVLGARFGKGHFEGSIILGSFVLIFIAVPYSLRKRGYRKWAWAAWIGVIAFLLCNVVAEYKRNREYYDRMERFRAIEARWTGSHD